MAPGRHDSAVDDLLDAIHEVAPDLAVRRVADPPAGLIVTIGDGSEVALEVQASVRPTPATIRRLVAEPSEGDAVRVLVARELIPAARDLLNGGGWSWLDLRGRLRLWHPPLRIDTPVTPLRDERPEPAPLTTPTGREVALVTLAHAEPLGIRPLARMLGRSPSSVSVAVHQLRNAGYLEADHRPVVPDLFWAVSPEWARMLLPAVALAGLPSPDVVERAGRLDAGLDRPGVSAPWVLRGPVAAAAWGAPELVTADACPDFFVADERAAMMAARFYGVAADGNRACTIAAAPVRWIVENPVEPDPRSASGLPWLRAHPVVVALDLATSGPRGQEVLEDFTPPEPFRRVW